MYVCMYVCRYVVCICMYVLHTYKYYISMFHIFLYNVAFMEIFSRKTSRFLLAMFCSSIKTIRLFIKIGDQSTFSQTGVSTMHAN